MSTRMKRLRVHDADDVPADWEEHYVQLWEEDDAPVPDPDPDKERTEQAFQRITGYDSYRSHHAVVKRLDLGDTFVYFYRGGWVSITSFDGGAVGVLAELVKAEDDT